MLNFLRYILHFEINFRFRCADCGYNIHEKCRDKAPKTCTKFKPPMPRDSTSNNFDQLSHDYDKRLSNSEHPPDDWHYPSRNIDENSQIIYQGYLFKQVRTEFDTKRMPI